MKIRNERDTKDNLTRLLGVFILIPIYLFSVIVIARVVFVSIATQLYLAEGYVSMIARELAQAQMMSPEVQAVLSASDALFMSLLVFFLITKVEKREFHWSSLGLSLKASSFFYFVVGFLLGALLILVTRGVSIMQGIIHYQPLTSETLFTQANVRFIVWFFIWAMFNGFWQELVFRSYLQIRVTEQYNATVGIPVVTVYFVLVHFIDRQLTIEWCVAMTFLFILISLLFHHTQSLYLVGAIHGSINYFDQVMELLGMKWPTSSTSLIWLQNSVILGILVGIYLLFCAFQPVREPKAIKSG